MSAVTRPRGPLPRRVYWVRRLFVALVAAVLVALVWGVVGLVRGVGGGGGGSSASPVVAQRDSSPTPSETTAAEDSRKKARSERKRKKAEPEEKRLARPSGPCADSDVVVTPEVVEPYVGDPKVVLRLTTVESAACTWDVSPDSVFLVISDEKGPLWSSQDCPGAVPTKEVVARRDKAAEVVVGWNGKQSDRECSAATDWVWPGDYVATAVARGSVTPVEVGFEMTKQPSRPVEQPSPSGSPSPSPSGSPGPQAEDGTGQRRSR